jgi:ssRNA-specific RNase YbeY (16S rRNA maturation enzyme)
MFDRERLIVGHAGPIFRPRGTTRLRLLVVHGGLHLCGWDHATPAEEAAMRALERQVLAAFAIAPGT